MQNRLETFAAGAAALGRCVRESKAAEMTGLFLRSGRIMHFFRSAAIHRG